jgi:hypothetical protein
MKDLPREIQLMIIEKLDPKSNARLRATSKSLRGAVDSTASFGSYQKKTGRFQKRFSNEGMYSCMDKIEQKIRDAGIDRWVDFSDLEFHSHRRILWMVFKRAYAKNKLLTVFREELRLKSLEEDIQSLQAMFSDMVVTEEDREDIHQSLKFDWRLQKDYRRRVLRLLKAWSVSDPRYRETSHLLRKGTHRYSTQEEMAHRDRLMDAIIVQSLLILFSDDPSKPRVKQNGTEMTLQEKFDRLVKPGLYKVLYS